MWGDAERQGKGSKAALAAGRLPWIMLMSAGLMGAASILTWTSECPSLGTSSSFSLCGVRQRKTQLRH